MSKNNEVKATEEKQEEGKKFKGSQLLKLAKYKNRAAKLALEPDKLYSYLEADRIIENIMRKKG